MVKANTAIDLATGDKINVDEKVGEISAWLASQNIDPAVRVTFRGANEEQAESASFLGGALIGALFLMFIILLTQFNSFHHSVLTLSTVVLSTVGVLIGMVVTGQPFSVIMTGTGIVALAGIVVNNSIVLIDTYQRLREDAMDAVEAVLRTAGQRLRPIMFVSREIVLGGPVSVWWVQLSTAIIIRPWLLDLADTCPCAGAARGADRHPGEACGATAGRGRLGADRAGSEARGGVAL